MLRPWHFSFVSCSFRHCPARTLRASRANAGRVLGEGRVRASIRTLGVRSVAGRKVLPNSFRRTLFLAGSTGALWRSLRLLLQFDNSQSPRARLFANLLPEGFSLKRGHPLQLFVKLQLPLVHVVQEFIDAGGHRTPRRDCKSRGFSGNHGAGSPTRIVTVSSAASYADNSN